MRTLTGTYTKNSITYNYTAHVPDAAVFVHSKHVYCDIRITRSYIQEDERGDPHTITEPVRNLSIRLANTAGNGALNEFRYTDRTGTVYYDIARMLQIEKSNLDTELNLDYSVVSQLAKTNKITARFYDGTTQIANFQMELLNGANDTTDKWWLARRSLRWFVNYPFTFDFQNINDDWSVRFMGGDASVTHFPYVTTSLVYSVARVNPKHLWNITTNTMGVTVSHVISMATDGEGGFTSSNGALDIYYDRQSFDLNKKCYLRWIGKHGEVFYWLFRKHSTAEQTTIEKVDRSYVSDRYTGFDIIEGDRAVDYSKENTLTIFSEMLNNDEYEIVKSIINSPYVDMLVDYTVTNIPVQSPGNDPQAEQVEQGEQEESREDTSTEQTHWQRVFVNNGKFVTDEKAIKKFTDKQLVLTLTLPREGGLAL